MDDYYLFIISRMERSQRTHEIETEHLPYVSFVSCKHESFLWFNFIYMYWTAANKWPRRECVCSWMCAPSIAFIFNKSQALVADEYARNIPRSSEIVLNDYAACKLNAKENKCKHLIEARLHLQFENFSLLEIRNTAGKVQKTLVWIGFHGNLHAQVNWTGCES